MTAGTPAAPAPSELRGHHPGPRSFVVMVISESKMVLRDTAGMIVPIGMPLLILLTTAGGTADVEVGGGFTALDVGVLPIVLIMVLSMIGVVNMPSFLAHYRHSGILKRMSVTPVSPVMVLAAQVLVSVLQSALGIGLALGFTAVVFGLNLPSNLVAALGILALSAAAMYALGMIVAAVSPTPNSAVAIGLVGFLGLGALGGMFGGREALPERLAVVGDHLPFGAGVQALQRAWVGAPMEMASLSSLLAAVVAGVVVSALLFRWE
ncbi:MAG: ABC transporter permease [Brachybacterium sp.]|uniref:ABC transporter permease n=1 Tax=unclassified Brachybacterium TaxID=2623841 RepID=UPI003F93B9BA